MNVIPLLRHEWQNDPSRPEGLKIMLPNGMFGRVSISRTGEHWLWSICVKDVPIGGRAPDMKTAQAKVERALRKTMR